MAVSVSSLELRAFICCVLVSREDCICLSILESSVSIFELRSLTELFTVVRSSLSDRSSSATRGMKLPSNFRGGLT